MEYVYSRSITWSSLTSRTSEANEGSLAHLLGEPVGVVAHPGLGLP
jgi:hypothetical protein